MSQRERTTRKGIDTHRVGPFFCCYVRDPICRGNCSLNRIGFGLWRTPPVLAHTFAKNTSSFPSSLMAWLHTPSMAFSSAATACITVTLQEPFTVNVAHSFISSLCSYPDIGIFGGNGFFQIGKILARIVQQVQMTGAYEIPTKTSVKPKKVANIAMLPSRAHNNAVARLRA